MAGSSSDSQPKSTMTRRRFLHRSLNAGSGTVLSSTLAKFAVPGLGTAAAFLAACSEEVVAPTVVPMFSPDRVLVAGRPQRIPFAIVSPDPNSDAAKVALPADDGTVAVTIRRDGEVVFETEVAGRIVNHDHLRDADPDHQHANLFRYYPLRASLSEPGIYDLTTDIEGTQSEMAVQIFDPDEASVLLPGDRFPSIPTPTFDRPDGVEQICTRFEPCPFHTASADDVLAAGRAMAVLIATPAFCSTAYCGPVLDTLIDESEAHPDIEFLHIEVYANPDEVDGNYLDPRIRIAAPLVELGLEFEPSLFLVSADGTVVDRIDNVFDQTELAEALTGL